MIHRSLIALALTASFLMSPSSQAKDSDPSFHKLSGRAPASARSMGQGEQMLYGVTRNSPEFLGSKNNSDKRHVQLSGVCRDSYGMVYGSRDKGYASCMDAPSGVVRGSLENYFGPAQRQAGV